MPPSNAYVSTTFAPVGSSVFTVLDELARRGIRAVELGSTHCYEENVAARLAQYEMRFAVHNYFPIPQEDFIANIASLNPGLRARSLRHAKECISFCRSIGGVLYTFHPGFLTDPREASQSQDNYDFQFDEPEDGAEAGERYETCFQLFLDATAALADHARKEGVRIAVETQGSMARSDHLLLQRPEEFERFTRTFPRGNVGINLNIGHLNLAANRFRFDPIEFAGRIADHVAAFEISHNGGEKDDHAALIKGAWYWELLRDLKFQGAIKIFEGRDLTYEVACEMVNWLS